MPRRKEGAIKQCLQCGKEKYHKKSKLARGLGRFCSKSCATTWRNLYERHHKREIIHRGRKYIRMPEHPRAHKNGYVLNTVLVMENYLGRPIGKNEIIHHRDTNKMNDSPGNPLVLSSQLIHGKYHRGNRIKINCSLCGKEKEICPSRKKAKNFCSQQCARFFNSRLPRKRRLDNVGYSAVG